jgi:hypothetical protein
LENENDPGSLVIVVKTSAQKYRKLLLPFNTLGTENVIDIHSHN